MDLGIGKQLKKGNMRNLRDVVRGIVREEMSKGNKYIGRRYGSWSVTRFDPVKWDDYGAPYGGILTLTNQDTFDVLYIQNDLALRGSTWFISYNGRTIKDKSLDNVLVRLSNLIM